MTHAGSARIALRSQQHSADQVRLPPIHADICFTAAIHPTTRTEKRGRNTCHRWRGHDRQWHAGETGNRVTMLAPSLISEDVPDSHRRDTGISDGQKVYKDVPPVDT